MKSKLIQDDVFGFFKKGHIRTQRAKKNIAASFVIKGLNIGIGLMLVPLTINYLDPTRYGIWITLSSIIGWFGFFDIGLGHGLRNRFAEALANGKHELARVYVSTTYAILSLIIVGVLVLFYVINFFLNWNAILNAGDSLVSQKELSTLALLVFTFFCLAFVFKLISTILTADQRPAKASLFDLTGKIISLLLIYVLTKTTKGSLLYLGCVMSSAPVLVLLLSSLWFFAGKYKFYRPSIMFVDFSRVRDLLGLGVKFFIIQIAVVLLYQTNNIVISNLFGPEQVTTYNVTFKYFSLLMMGFSIIVAPFWSAFTEAWAKQEFNWIKGIMRKLICLWGLLVVTGIIMLSCANWFYSVWLSDQVSVPYTVSALVCVWILLNAWNNIFSHLLNGVGKVSLQMYMGIFCAVLNVPLAIILGVRVGIEGVIVANVMIAGFQSVIVFVQYTKIIQFKANGIWLR